MPTTVSNASEQEMHPLLEFGQLLQERGVEYFETPLKYSPGERLNWDFDSARALCRGDIMSRAGELAFRHGLSDSSPYDIVAASTFAGMSLGFAVNRVRASSAGLLIANLDKDSEPEGTMEYITKGYGLHGPEVEDKKVLLVAGSAYAGMRYATMAEMIREAGGEVTDAFALVDRSAERAHHNLGRIGIKYRSLYQMDDATGELWVSDSVRGDFDRIRPAEAARVLDALLDVGTFQVKESGFWQFAGGQHSNNKVDFEEAYRHPKVLRLILESLKRMALPYRPDLIVPVAEGANQLGLLLSVHMGLDIAYLEKDQIGPGIKTFKYRSEADHARIEQSEGLVIVEDISNRRTSVDGVLQLPEVRAKAKIALSILDRGLPGETIGLPIPEHSIVTYPLSNNIDHSHPLYSRAVKLKD